MISTTAYWLERGWWEDEHGTTRDLVMEHRWGTRHSLEMSVRLDAGPHLLALGRVRDASSSGAYIETGAAPPLLTRICVELERNTSRRDEYRRIPGYVVRRDEAGVALEWCEFAPRAIVALIEGQKQPLRERPIPKRPRSAVAGDAPHWAPHATHGFASGELSPHAGR